MSAGVDIRRATAADAAAILALSRASYAKWVAVIGMEPLPMLADYGRFIADHEAWVVDGEEGVAAALVLELSPDLFHVWNIVVAEHASGRGLGGRLMRFAEARALALGYAEIDLLTNEKMTTNRAWYAKLGFEEYGRREREGRKAVLMRKRLASPKAM